MTTLLWIVGYLVVGFVVAVLEARTGRYGREADGYLTITVLAWPVCGLALLGVLARWCARRLP